MKRHALLLLASLTLGCAGVVSNRVLLEERQDGADYLEAVRRSAESRGHEVRYTEGRQLNVAINREQRTWVIFQVRRRGITMQAQTRGGEEVPPEVANAEIDTAVAEGQAIYADAANHYAQMQAEAEALARAEAQAEAERAAQREADAAERAQRQQEMAEFAARNRERHDAFMNRNDAPPAGGATESGTTGGSSSLRCCVNGAAYSCPDSVAMDQCAGRFMRCLQREGMAGAESCLRTDPPDPSSCDRDPGQDNQC